MKEVYEKLEQCYKSVREKIDFIPQIGIVLGSGLGELADEINIVAALNYSDITGFPTSTVAGHKGRFVFGYIEDVPVVIMQGRVHFYEGYPMSDVVLPIRLMKLMGIKVLLLTNAAGGVNTNFTPGDFMLITDQIASFVPSPLIGENIEQLGTRFPDMSQIYDENLNIIIRQEAIKLNIALKEGIYVQFTGPAYESKAEVRMSRILGGDAVGMSTACEAIVGNHMGLKVCGISCISNMACGITEEPLSHTEVQEVADQVSVSFKEFIKKSVVSISKVQ